MSEPFAAAPTADHLLGAMIRPARRAEDRCMPNIGPMELVIVLAIALVILGPKRLPDAGRSLGRGLREFKDGIAGRDRDRDAEPREAIERRAAA
jgi:sec-independent protein translocase protein TatA